MAEFEPIVSWVLRQEDSKLSGVVVNLGDNQGLTRFGIGQKSNPDAPADFYTKPPVLALIDAEKIYRAKYWNPIQGDLIESNDVAASLFSFCVQNGVSRAVKLLQSCLDLPADGVMGPQTLAHTNAFGARIVGSTLRAAQADWYRKIVDNQPTDVRFLRGWLSRAKRIYPGLD